MHFKTISSSFKMYIHLYPNKLFNYHLTCGATKVAYFVHTKLYLYGTIVVHCTHAMLNRLWYISCKVHTCNGYLIWHNRCLMHTCSANPVWYNSWVSYSAQHWQRNYFLLYKEIKSWYDKLWKSLLTKSEWI